MIVRQTFSDHVVSHICQLLRTGELQPGDKVYESRLASGLGVSRAPVREAVHHLVGEGLLDYRPQVGSFVAKLTPQQIVDTYIARGLLEGFAIAESGPVYSPAEQQALWQLCDLMESSALAGDDEVLIDAGARFHRQLYSRTRNTQLLGTIERLSNKLHLLFYRHWSRLYAPVEIRLRHQQLVELVLAKETWAIEQGFRQHYIETGRKVADLYNIPY